MGSNRVRRTEDDFVAERKQRQQSDDAELKQQVAEFNALKKKLPTNDTPEWSQTTLAKAKALPDPCKVMHERIAFLTIAWNRRLKLEEHAPSPPKRPAKYSMSFTRRNNFLGSHSWAATYAAKHFFDAIFGDAKLKWLDDFTVTDPDTELTCKCEPNLEEIIEHKFTKAEREWMLPTPYKEYAHFIRTGEKSRHVKVDATSNDDRTPSNPRSTTGGNRRAVNKEGLTSLADLCAEIGIEPREARQTLRKKFTKPDAGWYFNEQQVEEVKKILGKGNDADKKVHGKNTRK